jgi:peptidoglycan/xylan/chitin deacetylase (PgdA/CDA1 family)
MGQIVDNDIAIGIHVDSLTESAQSPEGTLDPTYFSVLDRFLEIAERRNIPLTFFVIGKELLQKEHAARISLAAALGHEIASHSWSHPVDLSYLPKDEIEQEIKMSRDIILETTGISPKGFVGPGWATSKTIQESLIANSFSYDTSPFPSWVMMPQYLFWIAHFLFKPNFRRFLRRGFDVHQCLTLPKQPYILRSSNGPGTLTMLPIPTTSMNIACWHSLGFALGWDTYFRIVKNSLANSKAFHYVMHIGDLVAPEDWKDNFSSSSMPRRDVPISEKILRFEQVLDIFEQAGREVVRMENLANNVHPATKSIK